MQLDGLSLIINYEQKLLMVQKTSNFAVEIGSIRFGAFWLLLILILVDRLEFLDHRQCCSLCLEFREHVVHMHWFPINFSIFSYLSGHSAFQNAFHIASTKLYTICMPFIWNLVLIVPKRRGKNPKKTKWYRTISKLKEWFS